VSTAGSSLRVVVFGGAGFLGSFVADALSDAGHDVVIFDREPSPYLRGDQTGIVGDILDEAAVGAAVEGCDVIYNYAGIADIEEASERPLETVRANVLGCTVILEAARRAGVSRYIFASTEVREFVHVWDAAASSVDVLTPEFENTHVTISGQQTITIRDLLLLVQGMLERPVDIRYVPGDPLTVAKGLHYRVSPYSFNPKIARKMMRSSYVDLGQGLLELMGDVHRAERLQADDVTVSSPEARRSGP
jgi:nucleoside-diphosphate-sugar epimerase